MKLPISEHALLDLNAPTLPAYELTRGASIRWVVWCKHCNWWHYHCRGDGHREAHCSEITPYRETGYNLALRGKWEDFFSQKSPEHC